MSTDTGVLSVANILSLLTNEEEFIFKPLQPGSASEIGATERGKIVSRLNKPLFDYQIGDKTDSSIINSIFNQRIILTIPETKQVVVELYQNRLPFLCRVCSRQQVRCLTTVPNENQSIGFIREGLAFGKVWYDIYNNRREHVASLMLRKSHIRGKIQHLVPEFQIIGSDESTDIGKIHPFSTDFERSEYGRAVSIKINAHTIDVETKAILLIATLIIKASLV